jgi:diadenosine tetraphosphatase ApaH/serine/threonine PP2A family protein phosphatase
MKIAVVSDIHANLHALEAVLAAIAVESPDEVWSLGDVVGYGAFPNRCASLIAAQVTVGLAGNHDLAAIGKLSIGEFSADAAIAARWTANELDANAREYLTSLSPEQKRPGADLFHGSPRDPVWDYVLSNETAREALFLTTAPLVLVGHTHVPLALAEEGAELVGGIATDGAIVELDGRWLLNPGSVGQPRDGDPRASWLLIDLAERRASFRRTAYDVEAAQAAIRGAALPDTLASRLSLGV